MSRKAIVAISTALTLALAYVIVARMSGKPEQAAETSVPAVERLHVEGTKLVNESGKVVAMKGVSFGWHNLWPRFYNEQAVASLHDSWGCNIFRASIGADDLGEVLNGVAHHPGYKSDPDDALRCLYAVIDGAIATGSYVLVDWHSHLIHLDEATEFFKAVATRYAGVPNVIYELFNEPVSRANEEHQGYRDLGDQEAMAAYWMDLKAYAESLIKTITDIDKSHPVILMGCPAWDQRIDLPAANPIEGYDNVMYTVHFYAATHKQSLIDASQAALDAGLPIFISECASCEASGNGVIDEESWKNWNAWADANDISMIMWSISDKDETCSMFTPAASSEGPWDDEVIKPWGKTVKGII